jgi:glycosyltransferase involved in cell wall biosynthesis
LPRKTNEKPTLLILLAEPISGWVEKGEIIPNYFNPGNVFGKIVIFTLTDEAIEDSIMRILVGQAAFSFKAFPAGKSLFIRTLGWRRCLLGRWIAPILAAASQAKPDLIRCYSAHLNLEIGRRVQKRLGIPMVVSLHSLPNDSLPKKFRNLKNAIASLALRKIRRVGLRAADLILPVYTSLVPYLEKMNLTNFQVAYNMTNPATLNPKIDYKQDSPVRVLWTGRQIDGKDPVNIVKAIFSLEGFHLTLIGDGEKHSEIQKLISQSENESKFRLIKSIDNAQLCRMLKECDIFVANCSLPGIPKTIIEAMLIGVPILVNRNEKHLVAEINADNCFQVKDSVAGYVYGLCNLESNDQLRAKTGINGRLYAEQFFSSHETEKVFSDVYSTLLTKSRKDIEPPDSF